VTTWLGQPASDLLGIDVEWLPADDERVGLVAASFQTPGGVVTLD